MSRRVVTIDLRHPYHAYVRKDGQKALASPTASSLLKRRKEKAERKKRVVIRHKREY